MRSEKVDKLSLFVYSLRLPNACIMPGRNPANFGAETWIQATPIFMASLQLIICVVYIMRTRTCSFITLVAGARKSGLSAER